MTETGLDELLVFAPSLCVVLSHLHRSIELKPSGAQGDQDSKLQATPFNTNPSGYCAISAAAPGLENRTRGEETMTIPSLLLCCALEDDMANDSPAVDAHRRE